MYVATRGLYSMKPPTIFVPRSIKEHVEKLFEVHRAMDQSELKHNLIGLNVGKYLSRNISCGDGYIFCYNMIYLAGEEFQLRNDLKVRAFKTYHVVPSQARTS